MREITDAGVTVDAGILGIITFPRLNLAPRIKTIEHILLAIRPEHFRFAESGVVARDRRHDFPG